MLEAMELCEQISGKQLNSRYVDVNRRGDHIWWISDISRFQQHYPEWNLQYNVPHILHEMFEVNRERWSRQCEMLAS
jgi:CDP-paratose 2-epimerase